MVDFPASHASFFGWFVCTKTMMILVCDWHTKIKCEPRKKKLLVIQAVTFLGWWKRDPFKGLFDLQLGDEKGTLNHLAQILSMKYWLFNRDP